MRRGKIVQGTPGPGGLGLLFMDDKGDLHQIDNMYEYQIELRGESQVLGSPFVEMFDQRATASFYIDLMVRPDDSYDIDGDAVEIVERELPSARKQLNA